MTPEPLTIDPDLEGEAPADPAPAPQDLDALRTERDDYLETLQRVQAEFENYRKRVLRERAAEADRAVGLVIDRLLPVLDAIDAGQAHHADAFGPLDGVLGAALVTLGVERIDPLGEPFDPDSHEAVAVDDDQAAAVVVEVLRAGYRCRGQLVRPALVRVGTAAPAGEPEG